MFTQRLVTATIGRLYNLIRKIMLGNNDIFDKKRSAIPTFNSFNRVLFWQEVG